jgi:hypothetical protein
MRCRRSGTANKRITWFSLNSIWHPGHPAICRARTPSQNSIGIPTWNLVSSCTKPPRNLLCSSHIDFLYATSCGWVSEATFGKFKALKSKRLLCMIDRRHYKLICILIGFYWCIPATWHAGYLASTDTHSRNSLHTTFALLNKSLKLVSRFPDPAWSPSACILPWSRGLVIDKP